MNATEIGIYNKLKGDSTLIAALSTTTAIYNTVAPQGTALPYVVFFWSGGGLENLNPSELHNTVYAMKAIADDAAEASVIQGYIKDAVHLQTLTISGYTNMVTLCEDEIQLAEVIREGEVFYHRGYMVRIRIDN